MYSVSSELQKTEELVVMKSLVTVQLGSEIVFSLQDLSVEDDCRQIRTYLPIWKAKVWPIQGGFCFDLQAGILLSTVK